MDLMLGGQLGHGFLFFQYFENDPDLQFDGITLSRSAHIVLKNPPDFCLNFPIHYKDPLKYILVPTVPTNTQESRFLDAENGSSSSRILVPEDDTSQEKSEFFGNQDEVLAFTEVD